MRLNKLLGLKAHLLRHYLRKKRVLCVSYNKRARLRRQLSTLRILQLLIVVSKVLVVKLQRHNSAFRLALAIHQELGFLGG